MLFGTGGHDPESFARLALDFNCGGLSSQIFIRAKDAGQEESHAQDQGGPRPEIRGGFDSHERIAAAVCVSDSNILRAAAGYGVEALALPIKRKRLGPRAARGHRERFSMPAFQRCLERLLEASAHLLPPTPLTEMRLGWLRDYAAVPAAEQRLLAAFRSRAHGACRGGGLGQRGDGVRDAARADRRAGIPARRARLLEFEALPGRVVERPARRVRARFGPAARRVLRAMGRSGRRARAAHCSSASLRRERQLRAQAHPGAVGAGLPAVRAARDRER